MPMLTERDLEALRQFDTPTICNAIELFNVRPRNTGYMDHRIQACFPEMPPMVGYASTATFRSAAPLRQGDAYTSLDAQVDVFSRLPGPVIVVFQDLDVPSAAAVFGEVMCTTYQRFGAVGLVTSGTGRDLEQVRALRFPVFTNGTICSHGYCHTPSIHVPVQVGGLTVFPGDLLHADCNGVTSIPLEIAAEVPGVCAEVMQAEAIVLNYLKSGSVTLPGYAEARKAMQAALARISQRVSRAR